MSRSAPEVVLEQALAAATETRAIALGQDLLPETPAFFRRQFGGRPAVVVADPHTLTAAGHAVQAAFSAAAHPILEPLLLTDPLLSAEYGYVEWLATELQARDAIPVAVGSGTINDLVKLAAHQTGRPYLAVATAASMDGYTAFGASITRHGSKQTFACPAPSAVIADLGVLSAAPAGLAAAGYGDLLAKITAGADWIVADGLGVEPIDPPAWALVQPPLRAALENPGRVRHGDADAVRQLTRGLLLTGLAMQRTRTSRPASGAEHQFSHLWDMERHTHAGRAPAHGFKVGVATAAVTDLYEALLRLPLERLDPEARLAAWPGRRRRLEQLSTLFPDPEIAVKAREETAAKYPDPDSLRERLTRLRNGWPELRERLRAQLLPAAEVRARLQAAGAPAHGEAIGISPARLRASFLKAYHLRRRYTVLDLAVEAGVLEHCLAQPALTPGDGPPWSGAREEHGQDDCGPGPAHPGS